MYLCVIIESCLSSLRHVSKSANYVCVGLWLSVKNGGNVCLWTLECEW